jgi:uncharacterized protein with WD repeat
MSIDPKFFNIKTFKDMGSLLKLENATHVEWSPKGSFLAFAKKNYVILYGMADMIELRKFSHKNVAGFKISPDEKMIVTYSLKSNPKEAGILDIIKIWDIQSETEARRFTGIDETPSSIRWSFDGKLLALMRKDVLSIYETPDMKMMMDQNANRTSIKAEKLTDYMWSVNSNKLFMIFTMGDITKMQIRELPSRLDVVTKSYSNVSKWKSKWHPKDPIIGACMSFHPQKKNVTIDDSLIIINYTNKIATNYEIHFKQIFDFDFQPVINGLLAITINDNNQKNQLKVYKPHKLIDKTVEYNAIFSNNAEGSIYWNKIGTFFAVVYCQGEFESEFTLYCVENDIVKQFDKIKVEFHGFCWSSSGTLFATRKNDEVTIYSADGVNLGPKKVCNTQISWRPYKIEATQEEIEEAKKNMSALSEEYKKKYYQAHKEERSKKVQQYLEFSKKYIAPKLELFEKRRAEREKLLGRKEIIESLYTVKEFIDEKILETKPI